MNPAIAIAAKIIWKLARPVLKRAGQHLRDKWSSELAAADAKKKANTPQ